MEIKANQPERVRLQSKQYQLKSIIWPNSRQRLSILFYWISGSPEGKGMHVLNLLLGSLYIHDQCLLSFTTRTRSTLLHISSLKLKGMILHEVQFLLLFLPTNWSIVREKGMLFFFLVNIQTWWRTQVIGFWALELHWVQAALLLSKIWSAEWSLFEINRE